MQPINIYQKVHPVLFLSSSLW